MFEEGQLEPATPLEDKTNHTLDGEAHPRSGREYEIDFRPVRRRICIG